MFLKVVLTYFFFTTLAILKPSDSLEPLLCPNVNYSNPISCAVGHITDPTLAVNARCTSLVASPHCCSQFCQPATGGGKCDSLSGACFCSGLGRPNMCSVHYTSNNATTDSRRLDECAVLCKTAPTCKTPAFTTNGLVLICLCYCPSPSD